MKEEKEEISEICFFPRENEKAYFYDVYPATVQQLAS